MPRDLPRPIGRQHGLSLVELMISLALGLLLLGGVIHVFMASQQTSRTNTQLNDAQESLRFAADTLVRVIRQGDGIDSASSQTTLRVRYTGGAGTRDCLGQDTGGTVTDEFTLVDGELRCTTTNGPLAGTSTALLTGVDAFSLQYGADGNGDGRISDLSGSSEYVAAPADWDAVRSVRITLGMDLSPTTTLPAMSFIASMRPAIIAAAAGGGS
ncbi:MAG: PilW family protein [Chromatiales bacterium]|nr:PilW family protein [Chromatiales bacterium]